jgi:hypothetical protein
MRKYRVDVAHTVTQIATVEVEAESRADAGRLARDVAHDPVLLVDWEYDDGYTDVLTIEEVKEVE